MNKLHSLFLLFFVLFTAIGIAQSRKPITGKEPSWVTHNTVNYDDVHLDNEAEDGSVDILYEQQVFPKQQSFYCHKIIRILTEAGIQNSSEISVSFDPSYQQLIFHSITILRDKNVINQLNLSKIKTIQQEKDLHRYMYNGSLSSVLFLEDVRKGDVIEYSYSIKGFNPIFKGKYAADYMLAYSVPVYNLCYKLISSKGENTVIKNINSDSKPSIETNSSGASTYEWKLSDIKSFHTQDGVPAWYDPYPSVQVSDYADWKEVNTWAMDLFPIVKEVSPALQKKIADIKSANNTTDQQILATLRFVQDDIRYMGIEMGVQTHKPGHPDKIYNQRFGDCKDKSYLLCTMLQQLGIEAAPVLINSADKKSITGYLPSAGAFDHVTVRVKSGNNVYWFDPTISFQRGTLADISYPDYEYGLVIGEGTTGLTMIDTKEKGDIKVNEVFDIKDMSGDARLTVTTTYTGSFADDIRDDFNSSSNYEMLKTFKDYYTRYYEHIVADSLSHTDNELTGAFTTIEYYKINDLWEVKDNVKKAIFESFVINGAIRKPKETKRTMPFALSYPMHFRESVEVNVPDEWDAEESSHKIESPGFSLTAHFSYRDKKLLLLYEYENLKDAVSPDEMKSFLDAVKEKEENTGYSLSKSIDDKPVVNKPAKETKADKLTGNIIAGFVILLFIGIIVWRLRRI